MIKKMTIYDVDTTELIEQVAKELQDVEALQPPTWASFVKTGTHKERPPARQDWWYIRAASVVRKVRLKGPIGVGKLKTLYGGLKNMGHQPGRFKKGSGSIIRRILQQLEIAGLIKQDKKGAHKGRVITPKGIKLIDGAAKKINTHKPVEKKPETKSQKPKVSEALRNTEGISGVLRNSKAISDRLETKSQSKEEKPKVEESAKKAKSHKSKVSEELETKSQNADELVEKKVKE